MRNNRLAIAAVSIALAIVSTSAPASEPERTVAESLFKDAKRLMKDGDYATACPKLSESFRLDPAGGTMINLADCTEHLHKYATAYAMFEKARAMAVSANRADRIQVADEHLAVLAGLVSKVTLEVPTAARVEGLEVLLDGVIMGTATWGTAIMIDPGSHPVEARAPARETWKQQLQIGEVAEDRTIAIPTLRGAPSPVVTKSEKPTAQLVGASQPPAGTRTYAFVLGGFGVAALGAGTYFAFHAQSKLDEADSLLAARDPATNDRRAEARSAQTFARIGFGVGVLSLGAATYWLLSSPTEKAEGTTKSASVRVAPAVGSTWGLSVEGAW